MLNIIFDYDGTLNDTIRIYAPAFRKAQRYLLEKGLVESKDYSDEDISGWLGFTATEMWRDFAPHLPDDMRDYCSSMIGDEMIRLTQDGTASLYPNAIDVLSKLKDKGFSLLVLSNCKSSYMKANRNVFGLDSFFSAYYCSGDYGYLSKSEIFRLFRKSWQGRYVVVGDRYQDMEVALTNDLISIGCLYGYGKRTELDNAHYKINCLEEITDIVYRL